jgi:UDP-glucose 4-epimerase
MKNKRFLITIGSHIADLLVEEQAAEIVVVDDFVRGTHENLAQASKSGLVKIVDGDIRDRALLAELMEGIDVVFHQAAIRITLCAQEPRLALDVLSGGTFNVLEAAVNAKVSKVVAASSASVYGLADEFPTEESHHPYNNRTLYGAAKAFNEGMLRSFHDMYGLNYVALRYFNVYGPRMDMTGAYTEVLIRWMDRIVEGHGPLIFGDGLQTMDFIHVRDIARANLLAAKADVTDEVFNVASGVETSLQQLAQILLSEMGSKAEIEFGPERKVNPVARRLAGTEKARRTLGFESNITLPEGLRELVRWWQDQKQDVRA